jgi:hypothetical protein
MNTLTAELSEQTIAQLLAAVESLTNLVKTLSANNETLTEMLVTELSTTISA